MFYGMRSDITIVSINELVKFDRLNVKFLLFLPYEKTFARYVTV